MSSGKWDGREEASSGKWDGRGGSCAPVCSTCLVCSSLFRVDFWFSWKSVQPEICQKDPMMSTAVCLQICWQAWAWCGGAMDPILPSWRGEGCGKERGYTAGEDPLLRRTWARGDEGSAGFS